MQYTKFAIVAASLSIARAQSAPQQLDTYQRLGIEAGQLYESIGAALAQPNPDPYALSQDAQRADALLAKFANEAHALDWSSLPPDAAKQQREHLDKYIKDLENYNLNLHEAAYQAGIQQNAARQGAYYGRVNAVMTGAPKFYNKAVVMKEANHSITSASSDASATTSLDSKESKKEEKSESKSSKKAEMSASKASKKEEKEESKSSKQEEKSESKASKDEGKAAQATGIDEKTDSSTVSSAKSSTSTSTSASTKTKSKNLGAVSAGISGCALVGAVFALL